MKLLFVIGSLQIGGAERMISILCNELAERGHDVTLVYNFHRPSKEYYMSSKVREIDTYSFEHDTFVGNAFQRYFNKAANRFRDYRFFKKYIDTEKPDAVISFLMNWAVPLYLICHNRVPLVFSERLAIKWRYGALGRFVKRYIYPRADMVTIMSYHDKAYLRESIPHTIVLQNPLSFEPLSEAEYDSIFEKRRNILACGRYNDVKGFDNLIVAFSKIAAQYPDWQLHIAGKEDNPGSHYADYLMGVAKERNLEGRVKLIGFSSKVDELMKQYSVFCLSSKYEGFPNALVEAMTMGCACISYDIVTGPREIIVDGIDGMIVEDQNINELSRGLEKLLSDKDMRYRFGKRATEDISRFNRPRMIEQWETMLENLYKN